MRGALTGALALLQRPPAVGAVSASDAEAAATAVLRVHVQALPQHDRMVREGEVHVRDPLTFLQ